MFKSFLKKNFLILIVLILLVLGVYTNSLKNEFLSDDLPTIAENKELGTLKFIFFRPFVFLRGFFYSTVFWLAGRNQIAFRLFNIFTHLGVCFAFYFLISSTISKKIAIFSSFIFAIHPLMIESITWISGGYYPQYSLFLLLSLIFFSHKNKSKNKYFLSLLFYLLALFSSERTVFFPLVLVVWELSFGNFKKNWKKIIPFFILAGIWSFFFIANALNLRINEMQVSFYQNRTPKNPIILLKRILVLFPVAITSYLELIFWPKDLTLYHSEIYFSTPEFIIRAIITLLYLSLIVYFFKKNKTLFFWLSFFLICLLPFLTPLGISWIVAERYLYLSSMAIIVVAGLFIEKISFWLKDEKIIYYLIPLLILPLSARTIIRNLDWRNQDYLWLSAAKTSPTSPQNHNNLGDLYARRGMIDKAIYEFKTAIQLQPNYADAYHNLANLYLQTKQFNIAEENYQKAIYYNPNIWQSHLNLGTVYFEQGKYDLALAEFKTAVKIKPNEADIYYSLGITYANQDKMDLAEKEFKTALEVNPQFSKAQEALEKINSEK